MKKTMLTIAALASCAVSAQVETNKSSTLPPVVVTASPITQEESVAPNGSETVLVSRKQLDALNAQDVQTALRQVPGVSVSRYAPIGSYGGGQGGSVYIRGLGTARPGGEVCMYTDGAPRESGVWGHPLMDSMPVDFADSVKVQKNPHPAEYGGNFGAVDVETKRRREQGHEAEADLVYGRHDTFLFAGSAGVKEGPVDAYGGMSYKYSDGIRDHNRAILKSAFARLGADLSEADHIGFVYQRTDSKVEDPGEKHKPTPKFSRFDLTTDLYTLRFDTERETLKGYSLVFFENGAINWHKDHLDDTKPQSPAGDSDTFWLNWGVRNRYDWNAVAGLWLTGGIDVMDEGGSTRNRRKADGVAVFRAHGRMTTTAPYVGARYDLGLGDDWTLTPSVGTRYQFHTVYDDEWAPHAALKLDWRETAELFVTGMRGVHYPGVYTRAMANDYAKSTLDAEIMDYVAAGTRLKFDESADIVACIYHTDVKDRIDKTAYGYINSGSLRATGIEMSAHYRPIDDVALFGGGTFASPETSHASRLPRWTFTLGGTWRVCKYLSWTLDGQYVGSMNAYSVRGDSDKINPSTGERDLRRIDGALVFNTRLAVPLASFTSLDGELFASVENLTGQRYEYYPGYPMGGAMWYVGCRLKF